jgi:periplasmic protein TonB
MNIAQSRPRTWTPQIIFFSVLLHAVILYYVAVAFNIVPPLMTPDEPRTIPTVRYFPPPPVLPPEPIEQQHLRFRPHDPLPAPHPVEVPPIPFPPQPPAVSTADATTIAVNTPIEEAPVSQSLPPYPTAAIDRDIEGRVILSITIMPDGSVRDVRVVNAQPQGYFEAAAVRAVQTWRYRSSNVTRTNVIVHMDFKLRDG